MAKLEQGKLNKDASFVAVIMAGGSGTRFWPASRRAHPKQFLNLAGSDRSLIQATSDRLESLVDPSSILVVTAQHQMSLVKAHLPSASILAEPIPRNTAPCVGYAALKVLRDVGDVPMVVLPADHVISNEEELCKVLANASEVARKEDVLITIGIKPTHPETGYGYIRAGAKQSENLLSVQAFVEKPDLDTAQQYFQSGEYFWNSGMFVWRPSVILAAIKEHLPKLSSFLDEIDSCFEKSDDLSPVCSVFEQIEGISVDVGVMEKAKNVAMIPGDSFGWNDVGSWSAWAACVDEVPDNGNIVHGEGILVDSNDCVTVSNGRLIAAVGLKDVIIVETDDAVLVCHKDSSQDVKKVVEKLQQDGRKDLL